MVKLRDLVLWMLSLAASVSILVISAASQSHDPRMGYVHMAVAALVALVLALTSLRETRPLIQQGASPTKILANSIRCMGLICTWSALTLVATYGTSILEWSAWWQIFRMFFVLAGLCLFVSATLQKSTENQQTDTNMLRCGIYLSTSTLFGSIIILVALAFTQTESWTTLGEQSWAAKQVILFGALALAAVSASALKAIAAEGASNFALPSQIT